MIHDTDASLATLLERDVVDGGDVEIVFDAPSREWSAKRTTPTVDLFLFDIREDVARRQVELERVHDDDGQVVGRRRPPRRFRLSYLVTAWTQRPEDEHRLLSAVVEALLPHEELPTDVLAGRLADQTRPIFVTVGLPPPPERSIGEIWSAMGGELKPSVEVVCSVPFTIETVEHAGPPVTEEPRFTFMADDVEEDGQRRSRAPVGERDDESDGDDALPEEVVHGGAEGGPGRILSVRAMRGRRG